MSLAYVSAQVCTSGSSPSGPTARIHTALRGSASLISSALQRSPSAYRMSKG